MPNNPTWDDTSAPEPTWNETSPVQSMPKINLDPYQQYQLSGREISGPFGPSNPEEVLNLPQVANIPAALLDKSGIMQSIGDVSADFLRRTGINPAAQGGVPLAPERDQETYIPSPLEQAFPNVGRGIEEVARGFTTPENLALSPFAGLKPVQAAFEAQMAAGVPAQVESAITAPNTQELTQAIAGALLGSLAGAHGLRRLSESVVPEESQKSGVVPEPARTNPPLQPTVKPPKPEVPQTPAEPYESVTEQAPPTAVSGEAQPSAAPGGVTDGTPVSAGETPQANVEPTVTPKVTQVGSEPTPEGTGLKNAIGEVERASYGLPEATETERRSMGSAWIRSGELVSKDPEAGVKLVDQLKANPNMGLTDDQSALLLRQKVKVENDLNAAAERTFTAKTEGDKIQAMAEHAMASDNLLTILDAAKAAGERWGREGRWRQAIAKEDYSFASMERQMRVSKGGDKLTTDELTKLKEDHALIQQKLADAEKATLAAQVDAAMARAQAESAKPLYHPKIIEAAKKVVTKLDERADVARKRLKERLGRTSAGVDPTILIDVAEIGAAHLAHSIVDFAEWSDKIVGEFGEKVKPYLEQAFALAKQKIDQINVPDTVKRVVKEGTPAEQKQNVLDRIEKKIGEGDKDIAFQVQKLARILYAEGVRERDKMVKALHGELKKVIPDITDRQTADAFSGYGDFKQLSKDEVTVALRGMKGELQQLAKLEDMAKGQPPLKSGLERRQATEAERELVKKVNEAKFKFQVPISDPETQLKSALDTLKTTLENRIKDYQKRLSEGDFAPRIRRELVLDREATRLKAEAERAKTNFQRALDANRKANRSTWQKVLDKFVRVERFFKLSSPVVFGKLAGAALARGITTATEEVVGGGLGQLPGISKVARQAPREGGLNVKAMAKGLSDALSVEALRQSKKKATTGETDIESLYSKKGAKDNDWTNIMGQLHGALKTPVLLGEFRLSLEKRLEHAVKKGVDVSSPEVLTRIQSEAMDDAYRSIFMQRGFSADLFNTMLTTAEKSKKYPISGEVFARAMRFLMPVVRVPINIVGETTTGVVGTPVASERLMFHAIKGTLDTLDPKTADSIMRQFKKGSIGLGLMAIGYFNPQAVGGFDYREKRKPGAVKTAGFQIGGYDVPRWATHAPWFELMQIGATIRHVKDQHTKEGEKGITEGMWAAGWGLVEQTPFFDQMTRWTRASESASTRTRLLGEMAKSTLVPQAVSRAAEIMEPGKVKPKTVAEYVESGIPGIRGTLNQESPYK